MTYLCTQCALQGRQSKKKPGDFGIEDPSDLYSQLLIDGMWTRCLDCRKLPQNRSTDESKERSAARKEAEILKDDAETLKCTVCQKEKTLAAFPQTLTKHQNRAHTRCNACHKCTECQQTLLNSKFEPDAGICKICSSDSKRVHCSVCEKDKPRSSFPQSVLKHDTKQKRCQA